MSLIAAIVFHEGYHSGQMGILRRVIGKPGESSRGINVVGSVMFKLPGFDLEPARPF